MVKYITAVPATLETYNLKRLSFDPCLLIKNHLQYIIGQEKEAVE